VTFVVPDFDTKSMNVVIGTFWLAMRHPPPREGAMGLRQQVRVEAVRA
jgi:hypothetical protein